MAQSILDLQSRGDIGTASDTAYAQLGYGAGFTLGAEICGGFRVALAANLQANGSAGVGFLYGKDLYVFLRGRLPTLEGYIDDAIVITTDQLFARNDHPVMRIVGAGLEASGRMVAASLTSDNEQREATTSETMVTLLNEVTATAIEAVTDAAINEDAQ